MKSEGLARNRWMDPIDEFVRKHGRNTPRWAVFLTYHVQLDRLARHVLPVLSRRGRVFRTVVLSDRGMLEESMRLAMPNLPGAVNLHPVECKKGGVFHPKVAFLRAGQHVRVCFGSANMTDGGMGSNLELWNWTEAPELISGFQQFLQDLARSRDIVIDDAAQRSIRWALSGLPVARSSPRVWSSLSEPFSKRLRRGPERNALSALVLSPMFAAPGGIRLARRAIPSNQLALYTDIAVRVPTASVFEYEPAHRADQNDEDGEGFPSRLHAKAVVLRLRGSGGTVAWTGSANFTAQAMTKAVGSGGNLELMVRSSMPSNEVTALTDDLNTAFKKATHFQPPSGLKPEAPARAVSTVLSCELRLGIPGPRLVVTTTIATGTILLVREQGTVVRVTVKKHEGVITGTTLRLLVPDLELTGPQAIVLFQRIGKLKIPFVVNVPHVPASMDQPGSQSGVDFLLEDWLGNVRIPLTRSDDMEKPEEDDDSDDDSEISDAERRLDEVKHQGELDKLAVKVALLKKLARRLAPKPQERAVLLREALSLLISSAPDHLAPVIKQILGVS